MADEAVEYSDFNEYSNSTRETLLNVLDSTEKAVSFLSTYEFILAVIGAVLNVFHLVVLTRKSMRNSSTNVLMIGIGICDLFIMLFLVYANLEGFLNPDSHCWPPSSYLKLVLDLWASALKDDFRRLSAWLGMFMAILRLLIVKNSSNQKFETLSSSSLGWKVILIALLLSSFVSSFYWARLKIVETDPWVPARHCHQFPENYTEQQYGLMNNELFLTDDVLALKIFLFTDGTLKIIPAALLPILTFLLIRELRLAEIARRKISVAQKNENAKKDHTTNLVILMTVSFMFAEGPMGIIYVIQGFLTLKPGFLQLTTNLSLILGIFVAVNATMHCLICLTMSSQYRNCVRKMFEYKKKLQNTISVSPKISVVSTTSLRNVVITTSSSISHTS